MAARAARLTEIPCVAIPQKGPYDPALVDLVYRAFTDIGFLFVRQPIITAMMPTVYADFKRFFDLSTAQKMRYARPDIHYQRGYTPLLQEIGVFCRTSGPSRAPKPNKYECYMMGPTGPGSDLDSYKQWAAFHHANIWPMEVPTFQTSMSLLYHSLSYVCHSVLEVLEVPLDLPTGTFKEMLKHGPSVMRAIHYPAFLAGEDKVYEGACAHTDINLITVLPKSTAPGLRIIRPGKPPLPVAVPDKHHIVQIGDMLSLFSGGRLKSTIHKVDPPTNPEGRYSAAFFGHPRSDVELSPGFTAGAFLAKRLEEIGLSGY